MSDDFKRKLKEYEEGKLTPEEREDVEKELEKLERYQGYVDEVLGGGERDAAPDAQEPLREARILRRGRWKARFMNALTVLAIAMAVTVASGIATSIYYGSGEPDRMKVYSDAAASAIAVSRPNVDVPLSGSGGAFFTMKLHGAMRKQVGDERVIEGTISIPFLLGWPGTPSMTWQNENVRRLGFRYPGTATASNDAEWARLDKLPEGTVAEAYLSFSRLFATDELLRQLKDKNMAPVWFAADTGQEKQMGAVFSPTGFPYSPIWHPDDWQTDSVEEEKKGWGLKIVTRASSAPPLDSYGSAELRNENFLKTLRVLRDYEAIAKQLAPHAEPAAALSYLESNGVNLYGAVVTGPSKEILKLKQEPWVASVEVGEVRLWNWRDRP